MARLVNIYTSMRLMVSQYDRSSNLPTTSGGGTGFIIYNDVNQRNYLLTNRHVVDPQFRGDITRVVDGIGIRGHYQADDPKRAPEPFHGQLAAPTLRFHNDESVDLALVSSTEVEWLEGDARTPGLGQMSRLHISMLARTSEVTDHLMPGEPVYMAGYPSVGGEVGDRPVLVQGIVSSDPRFPATIGSERFPHSVLCHSFSWAGMSGSPILAPLATLGESRMVGVNAGHVDLQGVGGGVLSHFIRSEYVLQLLAANGDEQAAARLNA